MNHSHQKLHRRPSESYKMEEEWDKLFSLQAITDQYAVSEEVLKKVFLAADQSIVIAFEM